MVKAPFNRCTECDDIITTPLCSDCLSEQMRVVIGEQDRKLAKLVRGSVIEGNTKCISCGQKMGLCTHCFSKDIYEYLLSRNKPIATEFLRRFDFDLRQKYVPKLLRF